MHIGVIDSLTFLFSSPSLYQFHIQVFRSHFMRHDDDDLMTMNYDDDDDDNDLTRSGRN